MKKIFCVEDDQNIRELIEYALSSAGFVVDGFENIADKILEISKEGDLVITMGGGDIYKAAQILCKRFKI